MEILKALQNWYLSQCNDSWEHRYGVKIDTLDNPGWSLKVDLTGTDLENQPFSIMKYGVDKDSHPESDNWISCKVEENRFMGFGGPQKLEEIIQVFLTWASETRGQAI